MRIKDLADLAGTSVRTIRYYHGLGLLGIPESGASWRSYGFAHLTRLMRIRWLVQSGVPLAEVRHMLKRLDTDDERALVIEDLEVVLTSIDAKIETLHHQREEVAILRDRVSTHGRLSPLPAALSNLYDALQSRDLSPETHAAMTRERDLIELVCYRGALPADLSVLLEGLTPADIDELCELWEECGRLDRDLSAPLTQSEREQVADLARRTVELARRANQDATERLLGRAAQLDKPAVRAALDLAYRSPVYREFVAAVAGLAPKGIR